MNSIGGNPHSDIIKLYNPANSAALTQEQILNMQALKSEQIKELARAYPNMTMQRAYLLIIDGRKPAEKQLPMLSTFENLWNLRERNGMKSYVAYGFRGNVKQKSKTAVRVKRSEVLDLSDQELMTLPGFRTKDTEHPAQEVKVTKVKTKGGNGATIDVSPVTTDTVVISNLNDQLSTQTNPS